MTEQDFDLGAYFESMPAMAVQHLGDRRSARVALTRTRPLLFAIVYLRHHLTADDGSMTFSSFHLDASADAAAWMAPVDEPGSERAAWIAPRESGKSTWFFLVLPLWAAAHGHKKFVAAFAHSGGQAEQHLATFRRELNDNDLLRADFPDLCRPKLKHGGQTVADTTTQITMHNGFTFAARGMDSGVLGMKVGATRPDLIVLDDIEPDEASYSLYQMGKRRGTLLDAVLPLNARAHVVMVGTTTMAGGIVHQFVKHALGEDTEDPEEWIDDEHFVIHYYDVIITDEQGEERSLWPSKWPYEYLVSIRHTRSFAKNMQNKPVNVDGDYWQKTDIMDAGDLLVTQKALSLDPAVTSKQTSDKTGAAVIGLVPAEYVTDDRGKRRLVRPRRAVVERCWSLRIGIGAPLRTWVLSILAADPAISVVVIETNQGGDAWAAILHDLPVRVVAVHQTAPKEVRAAELLDSCQRGDVLFRGRQIAFETEALAYPNTTNDDVIDAVGTGTSKTLGKKRLGKNALASTLAYAG